MSWEGVGRVGEVGRAYLERIALVGISGEVHTRESDVVPEASVRVAVDMVAVWKSRKG